MIAIDADIADFEVFLTAFSWYIVLASHSTYWRDRSLAGLSDIPCHLRRLAMSWVAKERVL